MTPLEKLVAALAKVRVSHADWAGFLVHKSDETDSVIEYDEHCPACVIRWLLDSELAEHDRLTRLAEARWWQETLIGTVMPLGIALTLNVRIIELEQPVQAGPAAGEEPSK